MPLRHSTLPAILAIGSGLPARAAAQPDDSAFVRWGRVHAVPLAPLDGPAPEGRELAAYDRLVDRARVIGVGESVHNVHQFLALRFRLLRHLVERGHVTALALESGFPEALALDAYVTGQADSVDYGTVLTYGFGGFAEPRETMEWIRRWNAEPGRRRKVRVYGIDVPAAAGSLMPALTPVVAYLDQVDPAEAGQLRRTLLPLASRVTGAYWRPAAARYDRLTSTTRDSLRNWVDALLRLLEQRHEEYGRRAGRATYERAARLATVATQQERVLRVGAYHPSNPRDQAMADNVRWVLAQEGPAGRIVVWAHNAHVQRVPIAGPSSPAREPVLSMGSLLGRDLGAGYVAIGFTYGGSSMDSTTPPAPGSLDAALAAVGPPWYLLDFANANEADRPVKEWLATPRLIRFQVGHLSILPAEAFRAVIFVDRAGPATPR